MKIAFVLDSIIPTPKYGESERILWWLSRQLVEGGHEVVLLVRQGSQCKHAPVVPLRRDKAIGPQIPADAEVVHFFRQPTQQAVSGLGKPYLITCFENATKPCTLDANTVFLSASHAARHGGRVFVYPGLDFRDYGSMLPDWPRQYFHFLAEADVPARGLKEAISIAASAGVHIHVIGSRRITLAPLPRISLSPYARFHAIMSREGRNTLINGSRGLIFPVLHHEPFGLPIIESLYLGSPVFGTPLGALPELVCGKISLHTSEWTGRVDGCFSDFGCLSTRQSELIDTIRNSADAFSAQRCHEYAREHFSAARMAQQYLQLYQQVLDGQSIHPHPLHIKEVGMQKIPLET